MKAHQLVDDMRHIISAAESYGANNPFAHRIIQDLIASEKFDLGCHDYGRLGGKKFNEMPRLPFPSVYMESNTKAGIIGCLLTERHEKITGMLFKKKTASEGYLPGLYHIVLEEVDGAVICKKYTQKSDFSGSILAEDSNANAAIAFVHVISALSSHTSKTKKVEPSQVLNNRRVKKGKCPYFSYSTLIIDLTKPERQTQNTCAGSGKSPRFHKRRGHYRTLPSGKKTWVRHCVVGNPENGITVKDYEIRNVTNEGKSA